MSTEGHVMLGLPTRTEAISMDPEFAQVAYESDLVRELSTFRDALSYIPVHNHLNGAYHQANLYSLAPPWELMWRIPAFMVPRPVRDVVDAERVTQNVLRLLDRATMALEEARPFLDKIVERRIHHSPDRPYAQLPKEVTVTRHVTKGYAPAWDYTFNVYDVAVSVANEYRSFVAKTMRSRLVPFTKLSRVHQKAKALENGVSLVMDQLDRAFVGAYLIEYGGNESSPSHKLRLEYEELTATSDLFLSFSETHFWQRFTENGILAGNHAAPIIATDEAALLTFTMLWQREHYRRFIEQVLARKSGECEINGVVYHFWDDHYSAQGLTSQPIVNLLGLPVTQSNGTTMVPDEWATYERLWVDRYRLQHLTSAGEVLINRYALDPDDEPTREKKFERLKFALGLT